MTSSAKVQTNSVTFTGMVKAVRVGAQLDKPTIFLGTYGIAKSAGIRLAAEQLGYCVVDFRAGEILPEDVGGIGVPVAKQYDNGVIEQHVERALPDIIAQCRAAVAKHNKPVMLFLDEITSAVPAVQATLFQVLLDRMAGGREFPEHTRVVAAGNLITDRSLVEELARPLLNRAMVYNYTGPTYEEFDEFMQETGFHPVIRTFLKVNEVYICDKIDPEAEQSPTPRSWETASKLLHMPDLDRRFRLTALAATVGGAAAHELEAFLDMEANLVPIDLILDNPEGERRPASDNFAANYMQVYALNDAVNRRVRDLAGDTAEVNRICSAAWRYMMRFNVELGSLYLAGISTEVLTSTLVQHQHDLQTAHDGAYLDLFTQLSQAA